MPPGCLACEAGASMSGGNVRKEAGSPPTALLGPAPGDLTHIGQAPGSAPRVSIMEFTRREYRKDQCPWDDSLHELARWRRRSSGRHPAGARGAW